MIIGIFIMSISVDMGNFMAYGEAYGASRAKHLGVKKLKIVDKRHKPLMRIIFFYILHPFG